MEGEEKEAGKEGKEEGEGVEAQEGKERRIGREGGKKGRSAEPCREKPKNREKQTTTKNMHEESQ